MSPARTSPLIGLKPAKNHHNSIGDRILHEISFEHRWFGGRFLSPNSLMRLIKLFDGGADGVNVLRVTMDDCIE